MTGDQKPPSHREKTTSRGTHITPSWSPFLFSRPVRHLLMPNVTFPSSIHDYHPTPRHKHTPHTRSLPSTMLLPAEPTVCIINQHLPPILLACTMALLLPAQSPVCTTTLLLHANLPAVLHCTSLLVPSNLLVVRHYTNVLLTSLLLVLRHCVTATNQSP